MRFAAALVGAVMMIGLGITPCYAEQRVALVVGNNRYPNLPADQQLRKAVNDSRAVGDALGRLGFEVIRGENLSRQGLVDNLDALTRRLSPGDTALFFFSGHGVSLGGGNYILPSDVPDVEAGQETRLARAALGETDIVTDLQARGVRVAVVVLDSCRTNPFRRAGTKAVGGERGFARIDPVRGVFSLYSAGIGQTALDRLGDGDTNPNSVFTRVLVPALTRPGLDLSALAIDVREEVAKLASTVGHEQRPAYYDETIGGRVYLAGLPQSNPSSAAGQVQTIPPVAALTPATGARPESPRPPAPKFEPPNEPLPAEVPINPEVLRLVETHPLFANAPPVSVASYNLSHTLRGTSRAPRVTTTSSTETSVRWLRQRIFRADSTMQGATMHSGCSPACKGTTRTTSVTAANGLIGFGSKSVSINNHPGGSPITSTSTTKLLRIDNIEGRIFPIAIGNRFAFDQTFETRSTWSNDEYTLQTSCEISRKYDAARFHPKLTGVAYFASCSQQAIYKNNPASNSNSQMKTLFFEDLGVWISADSVSPREQIVQNDAIVAGWDYSGTDILKSFVLAR
jgi:hypothetical protein